MEKNYERLKNNPTQNHYIGAKLLIRLLYKNAMNQWYESVITYEIAWLENKNKTKRRTHNINENTIPPKNINEGDEFSAVLCSDRFVPFAYRLISEEYVKKKLINMQMKAHG